MLAPRPLDESVQSNDHEAEGFYLPFWRWTALGALHLFPLIERLYRMLYRLSLRFFHTLHPNGGARLGESFYLVVFGHYLGLSFFKSGYLTFTWN